MGNQKFSHSPNNIPKQNDFLGILFFFTHRTPAGKQNKRDSINLQQLNNSTA